MGISRFGGLSLFFSFPPYKKRIFFFPFAPEQKYGICASITKCAGVIITIMYATKQEFKVLKPNTGLLREFLNRGLFCFVGVLFVSGFLDLESTNLKKKIKKREEGFNCTAQSFLSFNATIQEVLPHTAKIQARIRRKQEQLHQVSCVSHQICVKHNTQLIQKYFNGASYPAFYVISAHAQINLSSNFTEPQNKPQERNYEIELSHFLFNFHHRSRKFKSRRRIFFYLQFWSKEIFKCFKMKHRSNISKQQEIFK